MNENLPEVRAAIEKVANPENRGKILQDAETFDALSRLVDSNAETQKLKAVVTSDYVEGETVAGPVAIHTSVHKGANLVAIQQDSDVVVVTVAQFESLKKALSEI